jgi:hypothetical protein
MNKDGTFSLKKKMLMVQVAVPEEVVSQGTDSLDFMIESLHGANAIAFDVFGEHGIEYPLRQAELLVDQIRQLVSRRLT